MKDSARSVVRQNRPHAPARVAELEAEVEALRRALARAGLGADQAAERHRGELAGERAGRAAGTAEAESRHGRETAAGRADLAVSEADNDALRRANADLAASRAALREREERLRLILASATDYAIFSMDLDRRITSWNEGAERLLGWSEAEIVGRQADVIFTPEDRAGSAPDEESEGALRDGRAADERWHLRKDGTRFWANGLMLPLRDPEAGPAAPPLGLLKIMRDETGRRRAEEALREGEARWRGLFERMQEGFAYCEMVHGPDGRAVDYRHLELNAAWERLTGVPVETVQGRLVSEAVLGIEPFWLETYARVVETGEPAHFEHRLVAFGRWFEVMAYRTEPGRFAAVFLDITERKAAEARRDAMVELGDRLRDLRDTAEIARTAAEVIGRTLGGTRAACGIVDMARGVLRIERDWTNGRAPSIAGELRIADFWADLAAEHGPGGVVAVEDAGRDPRTAARAAAYAAAGVRAFLDVPLVEAGRIAAILFVHDAVPRAWTAEEVAFVRGVADRAWAAVERARAEERLRASEARWRDLFQSMHEAFFVGEVVYAATGEAVDWRYIEVNGAWEKATGIPADDAVGRLVSEVIPGAERRWIETMARVAETGEPAHVEDRVAALGRWFEVAAYRTGPGRFAVLFLDTTERRAAQERQALLLREIDHRAKNALAVVQAMLRLTKADNIPTFIKTVEGRVAALARAHTLLASQQWSGSSLRDLVQGELAPFMAGQATVDGPEVTLPALAAQPVAMAMHELATNAAKHGALSAETGTVAVAWRFEGRDLRIRWIERGGPPVDGAPERSGFGSRLLDGTIQTQLRGTVERTWDASGLVCDVVVPLGEVHGDR